MPAGGDFRLELDEDAIADLGFDDDAEELSQEAGDQVAELAAEYAPKVSGDGAASIHAEVDRDDESVYADVSWDPDHFYMGFHELGTEHESAKPFLRPALDATSV